MIVAVDGPSAAGKGTLARALAGRLGYAYLDTGLLYRAVAAKLLEAGVPPEARAEAAGAEIAATLAPRDLARADLRSEAVSQAASVVSAQAAVRAALLAYQRDFAHKPPGGAPGAVLDGRDIGTVVCPEAEAKLFVTASLKERARRRHRELLERGERSIYARVLAEMEARDARDETRSLAPLRPAADALILDTTHLDAEAALEAALAFVAMRAGTER